MLYYRYRPATELAVKEFLYDELYFASVTECNDPFEATSLLTFEALYDKWLRLLKHAWSSVTGFDRRSVLEEQLAARLTELSPLAFSALLTLDVGAEIGALPLKPTPEVAGFFARELNRFVTRYVTRPPYFASFSRVPDNALMWSHYASRHQGHCLIFRALNGRLRQCAKRKRTSLRPSVAGTIATSTSWGLPQEFPFSDIQYRHGPADGDAFFCFPSAVFGEEPTQEQRQQQIELHALESRTKHTCWAYEEESRVTLSPPYWVFSEAFECRPMERLFHFEPRQLVGVILGAAASMVTCRRTPSCSIERDRRKPADGTNTIGGAAAPS